MLNRIPFARLLGSIGGAARLLSALLLVAILAGCELARPRTPVTRDNRHYVDGVLAYQNGDKEQAVVWLQDALEKNPNLIMARNKLGAIHRDQGNYQKAADQYKKVCDLDPYYYVNHYNLGTMYHLLNRLQDAAVSYLQALKLNPRNARSNMNLGMVYTALGNPELGLPYAKKATELDPRLGEAFGNLAVVQDMLRDYPAAEAAYRRALELDPDRQETAINLAACLVSQKRFAEAFSSYEQILKKSDSSLVRHRYGYALLQAGKYDAGVAQFGLAIKLDGKNHHAYNGLGDALIALYRQSALLDEGKRKDAIKSWKKSLELNPKQPRVSALLIEYGDNKLFP